MFKIMVLFSALLGNLEAKIDLGSQVTYNTKVECLEDISNPFVLADVETFKHILINLGYTDIHIEHFDCDPVEDKV